MNVEEAKGIGVMGGQGEVGTETGEAAVGRRMSFSLVSPHIPPPLPPHPRLWLFLLN